LSERNETRDNSRGNDATAPKKSRNHDAQIASSGRIGVQNIGRAFA
jgi:hypothetical protein